MHYNQSSQVDKQASPPPPRPFTLVQYNCLGSWDVFLSLFGSFSQMAITPSIVALQDPLVYRSKLLSFQLYTCCSPSSVNVAKPRLTFYVLSTFLSTITLLPKGFGRNNIMALELFTQEGLFGPSMVGFMIVNSYSTKRQSDNT